jgi:NAD(P)-dependent dehydrogenase (short-subunit alcohol dehydrogenase family)
MSRSEILRGKRVIVTGAGKGIGRETALAVAKNGGDVCVASRSKNDIDVVLAELQAFDVKTVGVAADISYEEGAKRIVSETRKALGGVDGLVCAAGYPMMPELWNKSTHQLTTEEILNVFKIDVLGSFLVTKEAIPMMVNQKKGVIVLFSSTAGLAGYEKGAAYAISKAANLGLVKSIASEYGLFNIRAYAIAPGNIKTSRTFEALSDQEQKELEQEPPMKRWGNPAEVAESIIALLSDKMSFVTGQTIVVDGGTIML